MALNLERLHDTSALIIPGTEKSLVQGCRSPLTNSLLVFAVGLPRLLSFRSPKLRRPRLPIVYNEGKMEETADGWMMSAI
jgi:hypothetical protein